MADYDSDSSGAGDEIETNVLLGYASKEPTGDDFSQLGGRPIWLDNKTYPSGSLQRCKICNLTMSLLLQLNGDIPDRFPGHERRLYVFGCRRKPCRRKEGSVRAFRGVCISKFETPPASQSKSNGNTNATPTPNLGDTLFGAKTTQSSQANPFSSPSTSAASTSPFSANQKGAVANPSAAGTDDLSETFAQKARISNYEESDASTQSPTVPEPWLKDETPYPEYYIDADKEYLAPVSDEPVPSNARLDNSGEGSSAADEKAAFESAMDKTFQRFADRLSQNPEQILRYEFAGQPLLYSKTDAVGKLLASAAEGKVQTTTSQNGSSSGLKIPRCASCGAGRVFELQLTPHAITELEAEEMSIDGMDWGTIITGACSEDCQEKGKTQGEVGYVEEWVGVQWEEITDHKK